MKKLTTIIAGFFLLVATSAFTPSTEVSSTIRSVFEKDFGTISNVKWTQRDGLYLATFKENGSDVTAAYDEKGDLLVTGRYVTLANLPEKVAKALKEKYSGYTMTNSVIELTTTEKYYLVDVQNDKAVLRLKCDEAGSITIDSKTRK